jgi:hypothetical protein
MAALTAWLNALIPLLAVFGAYGIAISQGYDAVCNPFWSGCTSISRAARYDDALFWFRGLMLPLSTLLVVYWIFQYQWLDRMVGRHWRHKAIVIVGVISALALTLYANFLGSDGDFYRFMRRTGVTFYFGLAMLAQLLTVYSIHQHQLLLTASLKRLLRWQMFFISCQWIIGLLSLGITIFQPEYKYQANNILEWNFALMMTGFYAVSGIIWKDFPREPEKN